MPSIIEQRREWQAQGRCRDCGGERTLVRRNGHRPPTFSARCAECRALEAERQRERRRARKHSGTCVYCTAPATDGQCCAKHRQSTRDAHARLYHSTPARVCPRCRRAQVNASRSTRTCAQCRHEVKCYQAGVDPQAA